MKVSVIIPVYNVEPYVEECIRSVMEQTLSDLEIVCVHDAGSDGSWDIVSQLAKEDPRIRLFENEENKGLATTRNRGLANAVGQYVYFLDSDDKICPNALEDLSAMAEQEQLDTVIFGADFIYETKELEEKFHSNPARFKQEYPDVLTGQELYKKWMKVWDWMPSQPRFFYRREFLLNHGIRYADGMLHEDEAFAFDVLMYAARVRVVDRPYFIRRFRQASIMSSVPTMRNVEGCLEILDHVASFVTEDEELKEAISFYTYKIFRDVIRKYRGVRGSGQSTEVSAEVKEKPSKMAIYHMVEASGLWEEQ